MNQTLQKLAELDEGIKNDELVTLPMICERAQQPPEKVAAILAAVEQEGAGWIWGTINGSPVKVRLYPAFVIEGIKNAAKHLDKAIEATPNN